MKYSRVLVTGAGGVIGRAVVDELTEKGYDTVAVTSADANLADCAEAHRLIESVKPDAVVHFAARVHGLMGNMAAPGEMYLENVRINTNVVEAARVAGAGKVVAMGSVSVYGDGLELPMRESDIWTGPPHSSEFGYAHAKRAMLAQLDTYRAQYGLPFAFAVSTNLFGPSDRFDEAYGHVLPSLISRFHRAVENGERMVVWGDGTARRDFLYSYDAARAIRTLLEDGDGVYNIASGSETSIRSAVERLAVASGYEGDVEWDATKPNGQKHRAYDISKISALGWKPEVPFDVAIRETYDWYAANRLAVRR